MSFLSHTWGILFKPDSEWKAIREEKGNYIAVFVNKAPFFALVPVISAYIGVTQVGWSIGSGDPVRLTPGSGLMLCGVAYFAILAGVYLFGEAINWMAKTYGVEGSSEERHYEGSALAVYVTLPIMLAGLSMLYPNLWFVATIMGLAGAYSVYLIYEGIPILMDIPEERAFLYGSSVVTVGLVLIVTTLIASVILWVMGIGPVYID